MNILKQAEETVFQRQGTYDKPENNFQRIADLWNAYLKAKPTKGDITPKDVALMMVLLKISRELYEHKIDNLVDAAGYIQCAEIVEANETID
jgi:hypothetical protein